jgi:hypothetical protein
MIGGSDGQAESLLARIDCSIQNTRSENRNRAISLDILDNADDPPRISLVRIARYNSIHLHVLLGRHFQMPVQGMSELAKQNLLGSRDRPNDRIPTWPECTI